MQLVRFVGSAHLGTQAWLRPAARIAAVVCVVAATGCKVGPDYVAPEPDLPDVWHQEITEGLIEGDASLHRWWSVFEDPILDSLIERAVAGNLDLHAAYARIREARSFRGVAKGEAFPDLEADGTAQRDRISEGVIPTLPPGTDRTDNFYRLGLDATWEIDVWGRISRSIESADADFQASIEDYRDVLVILYAEIASNYIQVRAFQERIRYAESNIEIQQGTLKLTQDRERAQIAPELDVRQAELNLACAESALPLLRQGLAQTLNRLAVLLGEHPGTLHDELMQPGAVPVPPGSVAVGIPANSVRQRPDIRRAERRLAAQTAQIGVATADLYPQFSLSGSFAFESSSSLFESGNRAWSFGPSFRWNIFDGGRVRNRIHVEEARTEQSLVQWESTVLFALEDVENAMVAYLEEHVRREALGRSVKAAERSVELVQTLYRTGLTDFQNVLDMERSLASQQDQLAESDGIVAQNLVNLYLALGGGWDPDPPQLEAEIADAAENGEEIF